jgi:glycosyltransferase involved in cell wall biosynthesis
MGEAGARVLVVPQSAGRRWLALRALHPRRAQVAHLGSLHSAARLAGPARRLGLAPVASTDAAELFDASPEESWLRGLWPRLDGLQLPDAELLERARRLGCPPGLSVGIVPPAPKPVPVAGSPRPQVAEGEIRACTIGDLHWASGLEYALHAVAIARAAGLDARLTIVGRGDLIDELFYYRRELGLDTAVEFVTEIGSPAAAAALRGAHVYLHASTVPGVTPGLLAGAASGLAVLATDGGALVRAIACAEDGADPLPRRDARSLARALERMAANPELARRLGDSARSRAAGLTRDDAREDARRSLYDEVVASRRSRKSAPKV